MSNLDSLVGIVIFILVIFLIIAGVYWAVKIAKRNDRRDRDHDHDDDDDDVGGLEGEPCNARSGTPWPFSGCNISAGICCEGKCSKECDCKRFGMRCTNNGECCSKRCRNLEGISNRIRCPFGQVNHGSYACCKNALGEEDPSKCYNFTCSP